DSLQGHGDPLEAIGQLGGDRCQFDTACLLEIRELRNFEAVEHHLPADSPCAEGGRFPVVFLEPNVVLPRVDPARLEAVEIHLLDLVGGGLEDDLKLVMLEQTIRILAKSSIGGAPRRLNVGHVPMPGPEDAEKRFRMHGARPDFEVERLLQDAAARGPELGQFEDEILKGHIWGCAVYVLIAFNTRTDLSSFSR